MTLHGGAGAIRHQCIWVILLLTVAGLYGSPANATLEPAPEGESTAPIPALATRPANGSVAYFPNDSKLTVCTSEWTPAVKCEGLDNPEVWTGFEIEIFKDMLPILGWSYEDIDFQCLNWDDMMNKLVKNECDLAPAGMNPTEERANMGLRFSVATLKAGMIVMIRKSDSTLNMWYFFSAMSTEVWLLMIFTGIATGIIVWLMEIGMRSLDHSTKVMSSVMWDTLGRPVQMRDYRLASTAANITAIVWSFLVFILMALYSANLTANLTVSQLNNNIQGVQDLKGRRVASWSGYEEPLSKYGITITPFPWDNSDDEKAMVQALLDGTVDALVLDSSALKILDADNCDTMLVGQEFDKVDQTVGFSPQTFENEVFVDAYNLAIRLLIETGVIERLENEYIDVPLADCKQSGVQDGYSVVQWGEVAGLWVILGAAVGLGILLIICYRIWRHFKPSLIKKTWFRRMFPFLVPDTAVGRSLRNMVHHGFSNKKLGHSSTAGMPNYGDDVPRGYLDGTNDLNDSSIERYDSRIRPQDSAQYGRGPTMNQIILAELARLHDRISDLSDKVSNMESSRSSGSPRELKSFRI